MSGLKRTLWLVRLKDNILGDEGFSLNISRDYRQSVNLKHRRLWVNSPRRRISLTKSSSMKNLLLMQPVLVLLVAPDAAWLITSPYASLGHSIVGHIAASEDGTEHRGQELWNLREYVPLRRGSLLALEGLQDDGLATRQKLVFCICGGRWYMFSLKSQWLNASIVSGSGWSLTRSKTAIAFLPQFGPTEQAAHLLSRQWPDNQTTLHSCIY